MVSPLSKPLQLKDVAMASDRPDWLNAELESYLQDMKTAKERGDTIKNLRAEIRIAIITFQTSLKAVMGEVAQLASNHEQTNRFVEELAVMVRAHNKLITTLRRRAKTGPDDVEMSTGSFNVAELQRELELSRTRRLESDRVKADEHTWWKRTIILWVVGGSGAVVLIALSALVTLAITHR
jgi:hypothetical protein